MRYNFEEMAGRTFARLTVTGRGTRQDKSGQAFWLCRCSCGKDVEVGGSALRRGSTRSCGCLQRETMSRVSSTHGKTLTPEYRVWLGVKSRCHNPKTSKYEIYGGKGVKVCGRWLDDFETFLADMGPRPSPSHSIDRIDSGGDYCPENCRWATNTTQNRNTARNRLVEYRGESKTVAEWAEIKGLPYACLRHRLFVYGWPVEKAIEEPLGRGKWLSRR